MLIIKNWIRWWGLAVFIVIALIYWLSIDTLIRIGIEAAGSQAMGAKVDVASTEFKLSPLSLSINGLAVTNPEQPMENLFSSDSIKLSLEGSYLLRRQIIVDQASINGLRLNSPRNSSGALDESKTSSPSSSSQTETGISGLSLPDPQQLIAAEKDKIKAKFTAIENNIKDIEKKWDKNLADLPDKETMAQYKQRGKALQKKRWLEKINDTKALQKDIQKDLKQIGTLDDQLKQDIATINNEIKKAKRLPEQEADRLLAEAGYSGGSRDLANKLFGGQAKQWLARLTGLFNTPASVSNNDNSEPNRSRGQGQWVQFTEDNPHPDFLIRQASINGQLDIVGETIDIKGVINDITHQAKRWHKPTTFTLAGKSPTGASINSEGSIDLRNEPNSRMKATFQQLKLKNLVLSASDSMPISLSSTTLNGRLNAQIKNDGLVIHADSNFSQARFATGQSSSTSQQLVNDTLKDIDRFDLALTLTGTPENPIISVKSNLDSALSGAFKKQASKQVDQYKEQLQQGLQAELASDLSALDSKSNSLGDISKQLESKKNEINAFSKGLL